MGSAIYMPVLKWKQGELGALRQLLATDRDLMCPLLELLDDTIDLSDPDAFDGAASDANKAWGRTPPFFIDASALDRASTRPGSKHSITSLFAATRTRNLEAMPVVTLGASPAFVSAAAQIIAADKRGNALRLTVNDLVNRGLLQHVQTLLSALQTTEASVDLVLDWGSIDEYAAAQTFLAASAIIPKLPGLARWRSIVFVSSSFPRDLGGTGQGFSSIERAEWSVFKELLDAPPAGRLLSFGDYAIAHPEPSESGFLGSAAIRYTVENDWLIARGRSLTNPRFGGFDQFQTLSADLIKHPLYQGPSFSWGDDYIHRCATGQGGPGNLTIWREVGTNHHLVFVARQLSNYRAPSTGHGPLSVGP